MIFFFKIIILLVLGCALLLLIPVALSDLQRHSTKRPYGTFPTSSTRNYALDPLTKPQLFCYDGNGAVGDALQLVDYAEDLSYFNKGPTIAEFF